MNGKVFVGQKALSLTEYEKTAPISGVILWVDDENCYEAGDETGTVIEQDCPYATQQMANNLLATLQGYSYQGLEANGAKVSPIAELGDGITVNGLYTQLAYQNIRFSTGEVMDVAAPGSDETLHEYKTEGETTKQFTHQIAETRSLISKTSEEILLKVENELEGLSSSFSVQLQQIQSQVTGLNGQMSSITQTVSSITSRVDGLEGDFTEVSVTLDGLTVTDGSGTTRIKGDRIETENLFVKAANITGSLTIGQLPGNVATDSDIPTRTSQLTNDSGYQTETGVVSIVNGTVTADYVNALGISASVIQGEVVDLLDDRGRVIGSFTIENSGLEGLKTVTLSSEELYFELTDPDGGIYLYTQDGTGIRIAGNEIIDIEADLRPRSDDYYRLGSSSRAWQDIYSVNDTTVTSDRRLKNSITYNMDPYDSFFDNLRPTPYKLNNGTSGRTHLGLIAQDVEQALKDSNLSTKDFAGFVFSESDTVEESGNRYALRYGEFISLLIYEVQQLKKRVAELEAA